MRRLAAALRSWTLPAPLALLVLGLAASCAPEPAPPPPPPELEAVPLPALASDAAKLDTIAWHLAGIVDEPSLPHADAWVRHKAKMTAVWSRLEESRLRDMKIFAAEALAGLGSRRPLIDPFGGDDFLATLALFPDAKRYVVIGTEAPGEVPDPEALGADELRTELDRIAALFAAGESPPAGRGKLAGALTDLLVQMAYGGQVPLKVRYLDVADDGSLQELETVAADHGGAFRLDFAPRQGGIVKTLYYFSHDLSNDGFNVRPGFFEYLKGLKPFDVDLVTAGARIRDPRLSNAAQLFQAYGTHILQDETGLPVEVFERQYWDLELFGTYPAPGGDGPVDEELRELFAKRPDLQPLGFDDGCLIFAVRKDLDLE